MKLFNSFIFIILTSTLLSAQVSSPSNAKGLFLSLSVGPKFPISKMAEKYNPAPAFDISVLYTDTDFAPCFFYLDFGYQSHSGNYNYYKETNHSSITANIFTMNLGTKYFFKPFIDQGIIIMPVVEVGATYGYLEEYHQYKIDLNINNRLDNISKFGGHFGAGISFFLLELMGTYYYLPNNQFIGVKLKLTMPVAVTF